MSKQVTTKRQYNLDLLRITAMFLIVLLHSVDHSGVLEAVTDQGRLLSSTYVYFIYALTQICVNCFVILSGYLLVRSKFKLSKLFTLWLETVVYALLFKVLYAFTGSEPVSILSLISCFVPITTGRYWFITIYFGLYLLSPFLNATVRTLDCKKHTLLNVILFVLMSAWSSIHPSIAGMNSGGSWGLAWFVVLYFLGAWFRLYYRPNYKVLPKFILWLLVPVFMTVALFLSKHLGISIAVSVTRNWYHYNSVPVYVATVLFVSLFLNLRGPKNPSICKLISFASPLTFGVYLIHAHANVDPWLWKFTTLAQHTQEFHFPLMQFGIVVAVFVICILIDALRNILFRPLENSLWLKTQSEKLIGYALKLVESFSTRLSSK